MHISSLHPTSLRCTSLHPAPHTLPGAPPLPRFLMGHGRRGHCPRPLAPRTACLQLLTIVTACSLLLCPPGCQNVLKVEQFILTRNFHDPYNCLRKKLCNQYLSMTMDRNVGINYLISIGCSLRNTSVRHCVLSEKMWLSGSWLTPPLVAPRTLNTLLGIFTRRKYHIQPFPHKMS